MNPATEPHPAPDEGTEHPLLSTPEFERFEAACRTLSGFAEEPTDPSFVDGYLCAVAASRRRIDTAHAVLRMAGEAVDRAFADPEAAAGAMEAFGGWLALRRRELDPETLLDDPDLPRLTPLFDTWEDDDRAQAAASAAERGLVETDAIETLQTGCLWASGFLTAVEDFADDWPGPEASDDSAEAELYRTMTQLIACLTLSPRDPEYLAFLATQWSGSTPTRDELLDETIFTVQDLRLYWLQHGEKPAQRIVEVKTGRNDPCPCGSGKKFKKCHGA
ncbi:MAG: SEC-C metal-binding domain-containing protein [Rubrivivax sp.]